MQIPLHIVGNSYDIQTVIDWIDLWKNICEMSYDRVNISQEIITKPGIISINGIVQLKHSEKAHVEIYEQRNPKNYHELTLDFVWSQYSKHRGLEPTQVVPELLRLHVPRCLFEALGVYSWFRECFPNCKVTFWEEKKVV